MKMYLECVTCFLRQALQAAEFSGADLETRERVVREGLRTLGARPWNDSPLEMAHAIHGMERSHIRPRQFFLHFSDPAAVTNPG